MRIRGDNLGYLVQCLAQNRHIQFFINKSIMQLLVFQIDSSLIKDKTISIFIVCVIPRL